MRFSVVIPTDKEDIYWKLVELKSKYKTKSWLELLELMIEALETLEHGHRTN